MKKAADRHRIPNQISTRVEPDVFAALAALAKEQRRSMSNLLALIVTEHVRSNQNRGA